MKEITILEINIPKIDIASKAKKTAKTLLGLCVLGLCVKGCMSGYRAIGSWKNAQDELDKKTPATLVDKRITNCRCNNKNIQLCLDTDGNSIADKVLDVRHVEPAKAIPFEDVTNGTIKSVAEWKSIMPKTARYCH